MIQTIKDLHQIKRSYLVHLGRYQYQVLVCGGNGCVSAGLRRGGAGGEEGAGAVRTEPTRVSVFQTGCMGTCAVGPVLYVLPDGISTPS
jgi:NADH-quinone oxidoreductase subunit F